uniref:Uncharacterized protein n=1 Tax=Nymphaea colorata TaxID=210225 RepID=A0A5K1GEN4_9MAGN
MTDYHCFLSTQPTSSNSSMTSSGTRYPLHHFFHLDNFFPRHQAFIASVLSHHEPATFYDAMQHQEWQDAMAAEIRAIEENSVNQAQIREYKCFKRYTLEDPNNFNR